MDVQAATATATAAALAPLSPYGSSTPAANSAPAVTAAAAAPVAAPAVAAPSSNSGSNNSSNGSISAHPGLATLPAGPPDGSKKGSQIEPPLTGGVAQLFNAQSSNVSVSFQVTQDPNEIVTVFTDKQTGKVIVQFPSETMIALAKFFDKIDDATVVNKKV